MDHQDITNVDRTLEGVVVTFGDGYTFLFPSVFLYGIRLKEGQLMDLPENPEPNP
jgi:hypothetical protein